jgi:protein-L-isoaspartate(D-aspartate) O-methyltransferase
MIENKKREMLLSVRNYLSKFGKVDDNILKAISKIDRKFFMPEDKIKYAYLDEAIGIEKGQTISQPSTVARMLSLLELKKNDAVLEIGTGSGWNASLIGEIVKPGKVLSFDVHEALVRKAEQRIKNSGFKPKNLQIKLGNFLKLSKKERFDKIIFTCGISREQEQKIIKYSGEHLNNNGILVCPYQAGYLMIIKKDKTGKITKTYSGEEYVFVPLVLD